MKTWRRLPFTVLALWAMLFTLVPQTVWSCPMTGRVDVAARVCVGMKSMANGEMPCAGSGNKCCKPLSVPASQSSDGSGQSQAFAATSPTFGILYFALSSVEVLPFVVPSVETSQAPAVRVYLARFANSPPSFWTQHQSISLAGRAPPVL
ncbi:hypothetical protein [Abditibacterium utsteinense]|nr:hypothetical protein [Abditibacterium utsteinense]